MLEGFQSKWQRLSASAAEHITRGCNASEREGGGGGDVRGAHYLPLDLANTVRLGFGLSITAQHLSALICLLAMSSH